MSDILGPEAARDGFGRPVYAIEGLAFFDTPFPHAGGERVSTALDARRNELERLIGEFWPRSDEEGRAAESAAVVVTV